MIATHTMTIHGKCPHGCDDVYSATFRVSRIIPCEVIETAVKVCTLTAIYQESLTQRLSEILVCEVTLIGTHGTVSTETKAGAP